MQLQHFQDSVLKACNDLNLSPSLETEDCSSLAPSLRCQTSDAQPHQTEKPLLWAGKKSRRSSAKAEMLLIKCYSITEPDQSKVQMRKQFSPAESDLLVYLLNMLSRLHSSECCFCVWFL